MVILGSDTEDEIDVIPPLPVKLTKEDTASRPVTARPNSPEGSGRASDDEPKGRRKPNTRTRVTTREFRGHIDAEATCVGGLNLHGERLLALRLGGYAQ